MSRSITVGGSLIKFDSDYKSESSQHYPTLFRRLRIDGIRAGTVDGAAIDAEGFADLPISDVEIRDVSVESAGKPDRIVNVEDFRLRNVRVAGKPVR